MNQRITTLLLSLLLLVSVGCRNASHQTAEQASATDSTTQPDSIAKKGGDSTGRETQLLSPKRLDTMAYEDRVRNLYSVQKTRIPKQVMDSAMTLKDPKQINKILEGYMNQQDSEIRTTLATKLGISLDSLKKILESKPRK